MVTTASVKSSFVRDVSKLSYVVTIYQSDRPIVLTVIIDAEPFNYYAREPIYDAELDAFRALSKPVLDFHVLNQRELPPGSDLRRDYGYGGQRVIYQRPNR